MKHYFLGHKISENATEINKKTVKARQTEENVLVGEGTCRIRQ